MILDGVKLAEKILKEAEEKIKKEQLKIKLAVVLVGNNELSKTYIEKKKQACQRLGIGFELFNFPKDIRQDEIEKEIKKISQIQDVTGIVVQLPLPKQIDTDRVLSLIPAEKDVEGFVSGRKSPVVLAVERLLQEYGISLDKKNILIIGKGRLVGAPIAKWLRSQGLDFNIVGKNVSDLSFFTKKADIIITGTGVPNLIKQDMVKQGIIIIDAGTCKIAGKTIGDVDFDKVCLKAKCITPCVGGIGPVTVACLCYLLTEMR